MIQLPVTNEVMKELEVAFVDNMDFFFENRWDFVLFCLSRLYVDLIVGKNIILNKLKMKNIFHIKKSEDISKQSAFKKLPVQ